MTGEFPRALTAVSGLLGLAIGLYVFMNGRGRLVNRLFLLLTTLLAVWAIAEAMTISVSGLSAKIFWTKFQGIGEVPLTPTYLLIALYFPRTRQVMRDKRKAAMIISGIYAPFILGLVLLYTTGLIYSNYLEANNLGKMTVHRTPFFWFLEVLGFLLVFIAIGLYLLEQRHASSQAERRGLLVLALAPIPMLIANIIQNFELSPYVTATQASVFSVILLAVSVLRYGLFIDIRSLTKRVLLHAILIFINISLLSLIYILYVYALNLGEGVLSSTLMLITVIPFMLCYNKELKWIQTSAIRSLLGREEEESRLLQELGASIRRIGQLEDLAQLVVTRVRESLSLVACAFMLREGDSYRATGYAYDVHSMASLPKGAAENDLTIRKWPRFYSFEDKEGLHSGYWSIGDSITRGRTELTNLSTGVFRTYEPRGQVSEYYWRERKQGWAMSVPLEVAREEVGMLWVIARRERGRFSVEECDFLVALSTQVAVSIKNAELLQELLDKSNRLQELIQMATSAQEEERIRISRELHDGLAPYFLDIIYQLDTLGDKIGKEPQLDGTLDEVKEKARTGLRDLRQVISDLRPSSLDVLGLKKSLRTYLERYGVENNISVEFKASGDLDRLNPLIEVTAFRIAQEALANISRHAGASGVRLLLACDDGRLEMIIEDDGVGFLEEEVERRILSGDCLGIKGMTERAELMQAQFSISSRLGEGTSLRFAVPLSGG